MTGLEDGENAFPFCQLGSGYATFALQSVFEVATGAQTLQRFVVSPNYPITIAALEIDYTMYRH